jgi:hypothetical protein
VPRRSTTTELSARRPATPDKGSYIAADRPKKDIKIIYFCGQNAYPAQIKRLFCTKRGAEAVQFLVEHFTILGFEGQKWMLIVVGVIAAFMLFVLKTRDRS